MQKKIGLYRVEERLGVGGMGEVYKAYDDRLDRWVAIKRIRPDKESAEDNRERFIREARATARLNHPSIVHVYDIFKDGESLCIVMEYLEGRTLDTMVMEGALKPSKVLRLGYEIATGLAEAHGKGIIHRDLKVENIIINEEGNAKILDFGLAKPILSNELDPNLTSKGQLVGTSRAMSPEYVSGEEIDQRSDLFSLGVLLYETSTGHSPFKAQNTLATLKQVMVHEQTPATEMNPEVPLELSQLIDQLLAKDPEDRPQNAREVADELGLQLGQLSSGDITRPASSASSVSRRTGTYDTVTSAATATAIDLLSQRRWVRLLALLLVTLGGSLALYSWSHSIVQVGATADRAPSEWGAAPPKAPKRERIVVADFENRTGEKVLDSLSFAFRLGLEQSRFTQVLSESQVQEVLRRMQRAQDTPIDERLGLEICRREGARALITGSAAKIGSNYSIYGNVIDPKTGASTFTKLVSTDDQGEILLAIEQVTQAIRSNLGETLPEFEKVETLERVTTRDLEALISYSIGIEKRASGQNEAARQLFVRALERDPDFAMAHANLARIYIDVQRDNANGLTHLDKALEHSENLTAFEEIFVKAWVARLRGTAEQWLSSWLLLSSRFPDEAVGHRGVGMVYYFLYNDFEKAIEYFERALQVSSMSKVNKDLLINIGLASAITGNHAKALKTLNQIEEEQIRNLLFPYYYLAAHEAEQAKESIDILLAHQSRSVQLAGKNILSAYFADLGNLDSALQAAQESTELAIELSNEQDTAIASSLISLALTKQTQGEKALQTALRDSVVYPLKVLDADLERLGLEEATARREPVPTYALFAKVIARNGAIEDATLFQEKISSLTEGRSVPIWQGYFKMLDGEILAAKGQYRQAIASYKSGLEIVDFFQIHESLARAYEASGSIAEAISEYQWIIQNRGRALQECTVGCVTLGILDWHLASYHLGRLYEEAQSYPQAIRHTETFLDQWKQGTNPPIVLDAQERLERLKGKAAS